MSSSSSDSDSEDFEPVRRIKINIRPKEEAASRGAADINEIKASVQAWRPLGPPTHPSLSRRQSSLSSMSSMSFGAGSIYGSSSGNNTAISMRQPPPPIGLSGSMHSSPSCSSLVNEFNNRSTFSNIIPNTISRTSSPLTLMNHTDSVPIAIAIQESIELVVKGVYDPESSEPKYQTRSLGNIKVAFPNAFAIRCSNNNKPSAILKLKMHSTENICRYYASRLIKDLDIETNDNIATSNAFYPISEDITHQANNFNNNATNTLTNSDGRSKNQEQKNLYIDLLDAPEKSSSNAGFQMIEFEMDSLASQLKKMYEQSPRSRYFNIDVLRYQIQPIKSIEECPLQVCAYWKIEPKLLKIRIDFKHPSRSGLSSEKLRDISFSVNLSGFIPENIDINSLSPQTLTTLRLNNNNNDSVLLNMNSSCGSAAGVNFNLIDQSIVPEPCAIGGSKLTNSGTLVRIPSPKSLANQFDAFGTPINQLSPNSIDASNLDGDCTANLETSTRPYITSQPEAQWDNYGKQLVWKFDNLLQYNRVDGVNSLFAKVDLRKQPEILASFNQGATPPPVEIKFIVVDSSLSKASISIDSSEYRMSMLKREIRSGRYRSEPYVM